MSVKEIDINRLRETASQIRKDIINMVSRAACGHPGGSLSAVEILIALYDYKMRYRSHDPEWEDRDRLIVSKGHASAVVYAVLAHYGFFPKEDLKNYRTYGSPLQGHVHFGVPGVEFNTGSLGHGLSVANGMALGGKLRKNNFKVYCVLGDGEIQEGSVWEAAMTSAHHHLDNVCAIVDYNKVQENGPTNEIKNIEPLASKWSSFGWNVIEVNGHDFHELISALDAADQEKGCPAVIIANTIKGKGVSFMEGNYKWHGKAPKGEDFEKAMKELQ
ncbi:MAG: transketolase [Candidatus Omnitrophota bacterium]